MKPYMNESQLRNELIINKKVNPNTIPDDIFFERSYTEIVTPYKRSLCINY